MHKVLLLFIIALVIGCTADHDDHENGEHVDSVMHANEVETNAEEIEVVQEPVKEEQSEVIEKTEVEQEPLQESEVKTFVLSGVNYKFIDGETINPEIKVKEGDKVRIEFKSDSGYHDWVIDEFSAATKKVRPDDGVTVVEFTADKKGTFEYYCSVGSHRANGMNGKVVVE